MHDDIILNKTERIDRCISRIREEYAENEDNLYNNFTKLDIFYEFLKSVNNM